MNKTAPLVKKLQKLSIGSKKAKSAEALLMLKDQKKKSNTLNKLFSYDDLRPMFYENLDPSSRKNLSQVSSFFRKNRLSKKLEYVANSTKFKLSFMQDLKKLSASSKSIEEIEKPLETIKKDFTNISNKFISLSRELLEAYELNYLNMKKCCEKLCKIYLILFLKKNQDIRYIIELAGIIIDMRRASSSVDRSLLNVYNDIRKYSILEYEIHKLLLVNLLIRKISKNTIYKCGRIIGSNMWFYRKYYAFSDTHIRKHAQCLVNINLLNRINVNAEKSIELLIKENWLQVEIHSILSNTNISLLE